MPALVAARFNSQPESQPNRHHRRDAKARRHRKRHPQGGPPLDVSTRLTITATLKDALGREIKRIFQQTDVRS
jgi:hypothetical protein